jgi:hypothetical protein
VPVAIVKSGKTTKVELPAAEPAAAAAAPAAAPAMAPAKDAPKK